jgi:hypothetical protein
MFRVRPKLLATLPAGILLLAAGVLWGAMGGWQTAGELAGWLMLVLVMGTAVAIATAAALRRIGWAQGYLMGSAAVLVAAVGMVQVRVGAGVALACLFVAWMMLWSAVARLLVPWGSGFSAMVPLALSGLCMSSPVAAMPLVHAAAHWGAGGSLIWQERVVQVVRHACPFLAVLDVMPAGEGGGGVRSNWSTLPGMYKWSGLGQEVPMLLPNIWVCVGIYAALAGVLLGVCVWRNRRRGSPNRPGLA